MPILFRQTRELAAKIDEFLDTISEGALVFEQGIDDYLAGNRERFAERCAAIKALENRADELRRAIENQLYRHSLIPESRGDVLGLLEHMDDVINTAKHTINLIMVEQPEMLPEHKGDWMDLAGTAARTAETVVLAARAFFRDPLRVSENLHKVYFHEKEGDRRAMDLKRKIFASDLDLARKMHLRYFAQHIDEVSDMAENVADRLSIYAIKRTV
jgi:predicted phosphate transport protein (TIGR00153 family)